MKINPSSSVLNTTSFFASLTKTTLYFSVGKQSEVNFGGGGLTNVRILNSMERWRMRCKPFRCYISKYSSTSLIRYALGIMCRNTQGIRFHSVKHTCIKRSILTALMPYKLLRGKQFDTNQTE